MKQFQMQLMPPLVQDESLIDKFFEEFQGIREKELTEKIISILEAKGYKITAPIKQVKDEYTFERAWDLYDKKVGCKAKLEKKWNSMSKKDRMAALAYIPAYVIATADKQFRKNFQTFLNQRAWEDEIIGATPPPAVTNENPSEISQLIAKTNKEKDMFTEDNRNNALRQRIYGMIELLQRNPQSLCRKQMEIYQENGTLERLGIQWIP